MSKISQYDLALILEKANDSLAELRSKNIFITGGTGFFGKWILEALLYANKKKELDLNIYVLTRDSDKFKKKYPHLGLDSAVKLINGDISSFSFPTIKCSHIIHAATDTDVNLHRDDSSKVLHSIIDGTNRLLEFSKEIKAEKVLLISSGAIYGKQPVDMKNISEDYNGAPDLKNTSSSYGEGKRVSELLGNIFAANENTEVKIARCFAFVGPYLSLDKHFAIGNFIGDVLNNRDIEIKGDGTPMRSYLYAADLVVWLLKILTHGKSRLPYNVGSEGAISIADLGQKVIDVSGKDLKCNIKQIADPANPLAQYVPSVEKAKKDLGLEVYTSLKDSIKKTIQFYSL